MFVKERVQQQEHEKVKQAAPVNFILHSHEYVYKKVLKRKMIGAYRVYERPWVVPKCKTFCAYKKKQEKGGVPHSNFKLYLGKRATEEIALPSE